MSNSDVYNIFVVIVVTSIDTIMLERCLSIAWWRIIWWQVA